MRLGTLIVVLAVSGAILAAAIGVAGARVGRTHPAPLPEVKVSVLERSFHPTRRQLWELRKLRAQMKRVSRTLIASTASVSSARPVELPENLGDAWIAEGSNGSVCTFIPDPLGGYGASCATQEDLRLGGTVTVLGGSGSLDDEAVAVMVVADGSQDPIVTEPDGHQVSPPVDGIGATIVPEGSRVSIGALSLQVPAFEPRCTSSPSEQFRRCGL